MTHETQNIISREVVELKFDEVHKKLDIVVAQTLKTNGRVTTLEKELEKNLEEFNKWRYLLLGGISVASLMGAPGAFTIIKTLMEI